MKAFLLGLLFLVAVVMLAGVGVLLIPLIVVLAFFLQIIAWVLMVIFSIWLLGKFIIWVWEKLK